MTEDFIYEEEAETGSSSNRSAYLTAVGVLLTIFVLAVICSASVLWFRSRDTNGGGTAAEIAAIETQNAVIAVTNAAVTQTISAMETEAARPTDTPPPPPTNTPRPTNTPLPTDTPVVQQAEDEETATPTADLLVTDTSAIAADDSTPTPISALSNGNGGSSSGTDDTLPQTGIETWGILVAAFGLIATLVVARRLRSS
jgi:hypothetical protein